MRGGNCLSRKDPKITKAQRNNENLLPAMNMKRYKISLLSRKQFFGGESGERNYKPSGLGRSDEGCWGCFGDRSKPVMDRALMRHGGEQCFFESYALL